LALDQVRRSATFENFVRNLLADFASPERAVLVELATHGAPGEAVTAQVIREAWLAAGHTHDPEAALDNLARTTLVAHVPPNGYQLRIGLVRDWIASQNR
jgi:hypothetical protein